MSSISPLVSLLTLAYQVQTPSPSVQERLVTLRETISPSSSPSTSKSYSHDELVNSFINFLSPILNGMAGLGDFESAVGAFARPDDFRQFWTLEGRNLIRESIAGPPNGLSRKGCDLPFLDTFVKDVSCRVGIGADTGMLVLVPGCAQVGDQMWWKHEEQCVVVFRDEEGRIDDVGEARLDQKTQELMV